MAEASRATASVEDRTDVDHPWRPRLLLWAEETTLEQRPDFSAQWPIYLKKSKLLALSENRVAHFWMIFGWFIIPPIQTRIWGIRIDPVMGVSLCHHGSLKPSNGWPSGGCGPSSSWRFTRASAFPKIYGIDELWWFYDGNNEIEWNWPWFTQMGGFQRHFLFPSLPTPEGSSCFWNSSALHLMVILKDTGIQDTSFWVIVSLGKLW